MKMKTVVASAFALTMLAGCSKPQDDSTSTDSNSSTGPTVEETILNGFETELKGTAKITYDAKYKVDVISEKEGMEGFKHDVDDKTVAEFDLTEGDLYLYVKRDAKEPSTVETPVTREALLYKDGETYKYVTTVMEEPVALANETEAREKVDELLERISGNLAGYVDTTSFVYAKDNAYEHKEFGLSTGNISVEDFMDAPTYAKNDAEGLKITNSLDYVGYHTDAGISDFEGNDGEPASTYEINTDAKGYVTSYTQDIDSQCIMNIMTPAPKVTIKGTKAATAEFGESLTKKTEIAHQLTTTKFEITSMTQGHVDAYTTKTVGGEKTPVVVGSDLVVGQFLAVRVTPAGNNTIKMVTFASSSKEAPETDGYFYFEIPEGKAKLTVNFNGSDVDASIKYAVANVTGPEGFTFTTQYFVFDNAPGERQDLINDKLPVGDANWASIKFTAPEGWTLPEGKKLAAFIGDAKLMEFPGAEFTFNVKEEKEYNVEFKIIDDLPELKVKPIQGVNIFAKIQIKTCAPMAFDNMETVGMNTKLTSGNWICVMPNEGVSIKSITINGKECMMAAQGAPEATGGYYCWTLVNGDNNLVIELN